MIDLDRGQIYQYLDCLSFACDKLQFRFLKIEICLLFIVCDLLIDIYLQVTSLEGMSSLQLDHSTLSVLIGLELAA